MSMLAEWLPTPFIDISTFIDISPAPGIDSENDAVNDNQFKKLHTMMSSPTTAVTAPMIRLF
ncbi:hypothetical protein [Gordonia malaquae]|uniref:hypothetical protein n=1 Tax=Gordonia malaquae TaxID=410332 RepID=UPI00167EAB66|nr:hypothetical protein [Gordonia malaquae]